MSSPCACSFQRTISVFRRGNWAPRGRSRVGVSGLAPAFRAETGRCLAPRPPVSLLFQRDRLDAERPLPCPLPTLAPQNLRQPLPPEPFRALLVGLSGCPRWLRTQGPSDLRALAPQLHGGGSGPWGALLRGLSPRLRRRCTLPASDQAGSALPGCSPAKFLPVLKAHLPSDAYWSSCPPGRPSPVPLPWPVGLSLHTPCPEWTPEQASRSPGGECVTLSSRSLSFPTSERRARRARGSDPGLVWVLVIQWEEKWVQLPPRQADSEGAEGCSPSWWVALGQGSGQVGDLGGSCCAQHLLLGASCLPGPAGGAGVSCEEA